jgi:Caspase domain
MSNRLFGIAMTIGIAVFMMALPLDYALAEKKAALVIGNSNYSSVPKLPNPSRDAISIGQMLRDAKFDVVDVVVNVSNTELKRAIRKFEYEADQSDIAVVFYAGHGLEINGANYLIPIDAKLASDRDADDEAITLDRLVSSADGASKLRVIILDACRDNPFTGLMRSNRKNNARVVSSGLGKIEPSSTDTLIAYAAKAGSTAEDGSDGQHSPFTNAILKNLTIPGLDIRLAFGRIRDDVMRATGSRQEPFVYGSLGGGNISLVPAPKAQDVPVGDAKADYELVARIGTLKAWEVFLGTHKTGFYADLARVQIAALSEQQQQATASVSRSKGNTNMQIAGNQQLPPQGGRDSSSKEALDWSKIKDSSDPAAFEQFIAKYPDAPLAVTAQKRLEVLRQAQREREQALRAAERVRIEEERKKAEALAAKKREEDERRAKALEAEQKAKAAEAERLAAKQREEDERRAKAAEAEQKARAAEAERKAAEARQRAEQVERERQAAAEAAARAAAEKAAKQQEAEQKARAAEAERKAAEEKRRAEVEAAAARAAAEKQAKEAEEQRKRAEQAAALEAACKAEQTKFEELSAKGSDGDGTNNMASFSRTVTCDRLRPQITVTLNKFNSESACRADQSRFDALNAKGSEGAGVENMKAFAKQLTCDSLRPLVASAVDRFIAEAAKRAATAPNSPQLVLTAQTELVRLGCPIPGKPNGALNAETKTALARFMTVKGRPTDNLTVTEALVTELTKQTDRVCPATPEKPAATSRRKDDDEDDVPAKRKPQPEKRQAERERSRPAPAAAPEPRARVQAIARPSVGGGGGGGGNTMIGVGF